MLFRRSLCVLCFVFLLQPLAAAPQESQELSPKSVVSRHELVSELEAVLRKLESESEQFVSKEELSGVRLDLKSLLDELQALDQRESGVSNSRDNLQQRTDNLRRPGF